MYARELMLWLHERLAEPGTFEQTQKRFESLREHRLLPLGRENAGVRLTSKQIGSAVLGFAHSLPGYAGHASLMLCDLRPVGGESASFHGAPTLLDAIAALVEVEGAFSELERLTLSIERDFREDEYKAQLHLSADGRSRVVSFVSKYALSLLHPGAEEGFDHSRLDKLSASQRSFGPSFFRALSESASLSRHLDCPFKTEWTEYETEEEKAEFHRRLGARPGSVFLNLRVEAQVTWPKEPMRIEFGGHNLVLFPKTKENSHSISIDLAHERISADDARSLMNRLLSVMSWCDEQPASLHEGWSGNPVPVPVPKQNLAFATTHQWHFYRSSPDDEALKRCLAFYRDGLNAVSVGLSSHAVLSFYRVIETTFGQDKWAIVRWINATYCTINSQNSQNSENFDDFESDKNNKGLCQGLYIYKWGRVATAHAATDASSDPDGAEETRRLLVIAMVMQRLARHFIKQEFSFSDSYLSDALG